MGFLLRVVDQEKAILFAEGFTVWAFAFAVTVILFAPHVPVILKVPMGIGLVLLIRYIVANHRNRITRIRQILK